MKKYFLILFFASPMVFSGPRQCQAYYNKIKANKNRDFKIKHWQGSAWFVPKNGLRFSENDKLILETFGEVCTVSFYIGIKNNRPLQSCRMQGFSRICGGIEYGD